MGRHSDDSKSEEESDLNSSEEEERLKRKKAKHSSHKKKKSKDKKSHKKKSKRHRRRSSSSEGSSGSEEEWVVKSKPPEKEVPVPEDNGKPDETFKKPKLDKEVRISAEDDASEWKNFDLPTFTNDSKRTERRRQKDQEKERSRIDNVGHHTNELNPYWKDGGSGLPNEEQATTSKPKEKETQVIGDGGLNYLRKAFLRAKEQANEEGRKVEDIISERWGSLETFMNMLEEAEKKAAKLDVRPTRDDRRERFRRPDRDSDDEGSYKYSESSRHSKHDSYRDRRDRDRRSDRDRDRDRRSDRDRNRGRSSGWRKRESPERSRTREVRPRSPENKSKSNPPPLLSSEIKAQYASHLKSESTKVELPSPKKSDSDEDMDQQEPETEAPKVLTDKEMNELNAKLLKAEMFGNDSLVSELKQKIAEAETERQNFIKGGGDPSKPQKPVKVVTKVVMDSSRGRKRDKPTETHKDGQRVRYFPDDDKQTLHNMFQREKMNTAADENALFARLAGKGAKTGLDYDADDVFTDKASSSKQAAKEQENEIRNVLEEEKQYKKTLDSCQWCFDGSSNDKHLIVSVGEKSYLSVPPYQSLTEGHCLIVPMAHASSATELDEDVWSEMQKFRKALVRMFRESDQDMVIFETASFLKKHPHMYLECIPMPKETGELAPIYFKKAIQECETEWSHNKKLIDLRNRDVRRAVPKGLPYFSVDFGDDSCGFAHVIEDEYNFPRNFAHEIVGGMMELDHHLWRKQKKDDFATQRKKVMEFLKDWGPHDWTRESN